jgi:hypothetical protein
MACVNTGGSPPRGMTCSKLHVERVSLLVCSRVHSYGAVWTGELRLPRAAKRPHFRPANHQTTACQRTACRSVGGACHMGDRGSGAPMLQGSLMGSSQGRGEYSDPLCRCVRKALLVMLSDVLHACPYCGMRSSDIMMKCATANANANLCLHGDCSNW